MIIITQVILAEHECSTNWGDCKSNKSNQIKQGVPREQPLREKREKRTNKFSPDMTPGPGSKPGTHWWKASALTTAPTLLPVYTLVNL